MLISNWEGCVGTISFSRDLSSSSSTDCTITSPVQGDEVCEGQNAVLNATPATGAVSYRWSGPNGFSQSTTAPSVTIPNTTLQHAGTYSVEVYNGSVYGTPTTCSLVVNPLPNVTVAPVTVCIEDTASLLATGAATYQWNTGATGAQYDVAPTTTTVYTVTGTTAAGNCTATATVTVTVIDSLSPTISPNPICVGEMATVYAPAGVSYLWSNGNTGATITPSSANPSSYTVVVSTPQGCTGSATVQVNPSPVAEFTADNWSVNIENATVQFTDLSTDAASWHWNFGEHSSSQNTSTSQNPSFTYSYGGTFSVALTVTSVNGCSHSVIHTVSVTGDEYYLFIPSAYTPNVDGKNELFQPQGRGVEEYEIALYSRWGELIYYSKDFSTYWDGKLSNGDKAPIGTYVYKIKVRFRNNEERIYKGTVSLIR
jgi:gliding motility-associated-like protein